MAAASEVKTLEQRIKDQMGSDDELVPEEVSNQESIRPISNRMHSDLQLNP